MKKYKKTPYKSDPRKPGKSPSLKPSRRADLYGMHAVAAAWLNPARFIHALYVTDQGLNSFQEPLKEAEKKGLKRPEPVLLDKNSLEKILPQGSVHQGLALAVQDLPENDLQDLLIGTRDNKQTIFIILDQVTDPHNVGAILRSACAFGVSGMILQRKHAPDLKGVLAKTACGALEHVPVAYETNLARAIETLQESGFFVVGLDERGEQTINTYKPSVKMALVLGAEGPGLRRLVAEKCDALVKLPTQGPIASLNVSNAAAVALYRLTDA